MKNVHLTEFKTFIAKELKPALTELNRLTDKTRIHLQKIVYSNLVNRFDTMIDHVLLDNVLHDDIVNVLVKEKDLQNPMTEGDLITILLRADKFKDTVRIKLQDTLRNTILRHRHSKKLEFLLKILTPLEGTNKIPRVNINTGEILDHITPQEPITIPYSICGYADWLYIRRNAVVHGGGSPNLLKRDMEQIEKLYGCKPAKSVKLQIGSIENAATFYTAICEKIEGA